ncbi:hypothetical protein EVAR_82372_1 [Eumeta japonica]|uniref:Uncharacterized protein n=1 Tax=Eumeta variegata TaxID=151549 RepID=A0A4C1UAU9_EUMVA|nr:hypothetical protein EVAR_82372_1 [Eumeta japonica]
MSDYAAGRRLTPSGRSRATITNDTPTVPPTPARQKVRKVSAGATPAQGLRYHLYGADGRRSAANPEIGLKFDRFVTVHRKGPVSNRRQRGERMLLIVMPI